MYGTEVPKGIRNSNGYILFFTKVEYWPDQKERYESECKEMMDITEKILSSLKNGLTPVSEKVS